MQAISEPVRALKAGLRGEDSNDNFMGVLCNFAEEVPLWGRWEDSSSQTEENTVETSDGCFFFEGGRRDEGVTVHHEFNLQARPRDFLFDVRWGEGSSMESSGELASLAMRPKMVSTKQVQYEELMDIEDGMEKFFYTSKVYYGIIHNLLGAVLGEATILWSERLDDDQERDWRRRQEGQAYQWQRSF